MFYQCCRIQNIRFTNPAYSNVSSTSHAPTDHAVFASLLFVLVSWNVLPATTSAICFRDTLLVQTSSG